MNGTSLAPLAWFAAILVAIPVVLWLLKRTPLGGGAFGAGGAAGMPRTVATLPLGPAQRVVTVEVGTGDSRLWLVLGVSAQGGIRTLCTMTPPAGSLPIADLPPPPAAQFSQLLARLRGEGDPGAR